MIVVEVATIIVMMIMIMTDGSDLVVATMVVEW